MTTALARPQPVTTPAPRKAAPRPPLRVVPPRPSSAPRAPFVMLVVALLGTGLVALLLLNAAAVANSNRAAELREQTAGLELREQQLERDVNEMQSPTSLASAAARLGMIPSGDPSFLILQPDGSYKVAGSPSPAVPPGSGR